MNWKINNDNHQFNLTEGELEAVLEARVKGSKTTLKEIFEKGKNEGFWNGFWVGTLVSGFLAVFTSFLFYLFSK